MPKKAASKASQPADQNRNKQLNPNRPEYWQSRGYPERPAEYKQLIEERRSAGRREAAINQAAHESRDSAAAIGRVMRKIEAATKEAFGGQARVEKGGSRHKHTNLAGADLDSKVVLPGNRPMTTSDRDKLTGCLGKQFESVDTSNPRIHRLGGGACSVDVVPVHSTYAPANFHAGLPKNGFQQNPKAQKAVRDVKLEAEERGTPLRGFAVENAVLRHQHLGFPLQCSHVAG
ncbi:unnamed protein product [Symbiodinium natans]|uniref:Uncharacterized protein n=1 Tax=Symbiodinium natans TaxID=878477 RepID=A0A812KCG3_9DINO|nr:unnamed protein product [Symbiodinium natans]